MKFKLANRPDIPRLNSVGGLGWFAAPTLKNDTFERFINDQQNPHHSYSCLQ